MATNTRKLAALLGASGAGIDNAGALTSTAIGAGTIVAADMGTMMSVGETAPAGPFIGQQWFRLSTGVTYQWTYDGTSSFWLDVSSGGIGTSTSKSVDIVRDVDPNKVTNLGAVGDVYYNRVKNTYFICTDATSNAQVWTGKYDGWGGTVTEVLISGTYYRVHTFPTSGQFMVNTSVTVDFLVLAGGGGGGGGVAPAYGAGGGAGGLRSSVSPTGGTGSAETARALVTGTSYTVTVGVGGQASSNGGNSVFDTITSTGGGRGSTDGYDETDTSAGSENGGSGAGGGSYSGGPQATSPPGAATVVGSATQGYAGGPMGSGAGTGGGGGAGGVGLGGSLLAADKGGAGGPGISNAITGGSGAAIEYAGGGGGAGGNSAYTAPATHGGGLGGEAGVGTGTAGTDGKGGGGGADVAGPGSPGGSGIVIIRYAIT